MTKKSNNHQFNIKDESQDRKYFSIVPNFIINHSTLEERGFYLTLKRIAGETGSVYYSPTKLGDLCRIKKSRVYELLNQLLERGWIKVTGSTPTGHRPRRTYCIVDLWKKNIEFYEYKKKVHTGGNFQLVHDRGENSSTLVETEEDQGKEEPKNTNKRKEVISLKGRYSSIDSLGEAEFTEIAQIYGVTTPFVRSKFDDLVNYCESSGKRYKNYFAALRNFVKNGAIQIRKEVAYANSKRGIDASRI